MELKKTKQYNTIIEQWRLAGMKNKVNDFNKGRVVFMKATDLHNQPNTSAWLDTTRSKRQDMFFPNFG